MDRPLRLDPRVSRASLRILADSTRARLRPEEDYEEDCPLVRGVMRGIQRDEHDRHLRVINPLAAPYGSGDPDLQCEDFALALAEVYLKERHAALVAPSDRRERYQPHPAIAWFAIEALEGGHERTRNRWRNAKLPPGEHDWFKDATIY